MRYLKTKQQQQQQNPKIQEEEKEEEEYFLRFYILNLSPTVITLFCLLSSPPSSNLSVVYLCARSLIIITPAEPASVSLGIVRMTLNPSLIYRLFLKARAKSWEEEDRRRNATKTASSYPTSDERLC